MALSKKLQARLDSLTAENAKLREENNRHHDARQVAANNLHLGAEVLALKDASDTSRILRTAAGAATPQPMPATASVSEWRQVDAEDVSASRLIERLADSRRHIIEQMDRLALGRTKRKPSRKFPKVKAKKRR